MTTSVTPRFVFGQKDIAVAGTSEQIDATEYRLSDLLIVAKSANAGRVFYGGSDVDSLTQVGLAAGESITLSAALLLTLGSIYLDVAVGGDGVDFVGVRA